MAHVWRESRDISQSSVYSILDTLIIYNMYIYGTVRLHALRSDELYFRCHDIGDRDCKGECEEGGC